MLRDCSRTTGPGRPSLAAGALLALLLGACSAPGPNEAPAAEATPFGLTPEPEPQATPFGLTPEPATPGQ